MTPIRTFNPFAGLRKAGPYLLFLLLGVAMLYGPVLLHWLLAVVHGAPAVTAHAGDATGAEVVADQQAAGWPTPGLVTGKLITAGGAYLFFTILPWLVQRLTHPTPTKWAKGDVTVKDGTNPPRRVLGYSASFLWLTPGQRFEVYQRLQLNIVIRSAAALLFAALVQ